MCVSTHTHTYFTYEYKQSIWYHLHNSGWISTTILTLVIHQHATSHPPFMLSLIIISLLALPAFNFFLQSRF